MRPSLFQHFVRSVEEGAAIGLALVGCLALALAGACTLLGLLLFLST